MWKCKGFIAYIGEYPINARYLIWDEYNGEIEWTSDSNSAYVFAGVEGIVAVCEQFGITDYNIRRVVMTDTAYNK